MLHRQLGNYIVKSRSIAGRPVYGVIEKKLGDHKVDALNLALIAYKLEMSDFAPFNAAAGPMRMSFLPTSQVPILHKGLESVMKEEAAIVSRLPEERDISPFTGNQLPLFRPGFFTDEDDKFMKNRIVKRKSRTSYTVDRQSVPSRRF
jgi:hypothetical protein